MYNYVATYYLDRTFRVKFPIPKPCYWTEKDRNLGRRSLRSSRDVRFYSFK